MFEGVVESFAPGAFASGVLLPGVAALPGAAEGVLFAGVLERPAVGVFAEGVPLVAVVPGFEGAALGAFPTADVVGALLGAGVGAAVLGAGDGALAGAGVVLLGAAVGGLDTGGFAATGGLLAALVEGELIFCIYTSNLTNRQTGHLASGTTTYPIHHHQH